MPSLSTRMGQGNMKVIRQAMGYQLTAKPSAGGQAYKFKGGGAPKKAAPAVKPKAPAVTPNRPMPAYRPQQRQRPRPPMAAPKAPNAKLKPQAITTATKARAASNRGVRPQF